MIKIAKKISLVTLGVADVARSTDFYERLGWHKSKGASQDAITFIALDNLVLGLFSRDALTHDANIAAARTTLPDFNGVTLAINLASEEEVDIALAHAVKAGAFLLKPAQKVFWGGYSGYFSDPDGQIWEVAYNPFFPLSAEGHVILPE